MDRHTPLPADLANWPKDPYQLLGVETGVAAKELRRAYVRLIRIYKPEQFPEEFRRIREAYEFLEQFATYQVAPIQDNSTDVKAEAIAPPLEAIDPPAPISDLVIDSGGHEAELGRAWEMALAGNEAAAYKSLLDQEACDPGYPAICVRLYWLLAALPQLDHTRQPCDWLLRGLTRVLGDETLHELYRQELADRPEEAHTERFARLLALPLPVTERVDLIRKRWQSAIRLGRWTVLQADLEDRNNPIRQDAKQTWIWLLFSLAEMVGWDEALAAQETLERCLKQIHLYVQLDREYDNEMDRLDHLQETWRRYRDVAMPSSLRSLIGRSTIWPAAALRNMFDNLCMLIEAAPTTWHRHLDILRAHAPLALDRLGQLFASFGQSDETPEREVNGHRSAASIARFVKRLERADYFHNRDVILTFCLQQSISPLALVHLAGDTWLRIGPEQVKLADVLGTDKPLHLVYAAHARVRNL